MTAEPNWTRIPGTRDVDLLSFVCKPSICYANAYLLRGPEALVVIDPGADLRTAGGIRTLLLDLVRERPRPVFVLLTHCHHDHGASVPLFQDPEVGGVLVCHHLALQALIRRDPDATLYTYYGNESAEVRGGFPLFGDRPAPELPDLLCVHPGRDRPGASLRLGLGDVLDIHHTPGHTPDGLTFRVGACLFPGDLPFAANSGIAGVPGWDARGLRDSLSFVAGLCAEAQTVLPGHGDSMAGKTAMRILDRQARQSEGLEDLVRLDKARCAVLTSHTLTLVHEVQRVLAIIGGCLLKISHLLEGLGEPEAAARVLARLDVDTAETLLAELRQYRVQTLDCPVFQDKLYFRASQTVARLEKMFRPDALDGLVDPSLPRRCRRLLTDYMNTVLGVRYEAPEASFGLAEAVEGLLARLRQPGADPAELLAASGDHDGFVRVLEQALADNRLFSRTRLRFQAPETPLRAAGDRHALEDLLLAVLEQAAVGGAREVDIRARVENGRIRLDIRAEEGRALRLDGAVGDYLRFALDHLHGDLLLTPQAPNRCGILLPVGA